MFQLDVTTINTTSWAILCLSIHRSTNVKFLKYLKQHTTDAYLLSWYMSKSQPNHVRIWLLLDDITFAM